MTTLLESPKSESSSLSSFGYAQQLHRNLGSYASFAAGFSFISVLTTVFQLTSLGYSFAGPAFWWTWPVVLGGQLLVALCFCELAARYPISGAIYQWSTRMGNRAWGWFAGWTMIIGQIVVVTAAAVALQVVLPTLWVGFQLVGGDPSLSSPTGALNAVIIASTLITLTTIVNVIGIRLMSWINSIGVTCELVGAVVMIVLLCAHASRGPAVVLSTGGTAGSGGYLWALLLGAFTALYVLIGFDSAGELSEETRDARRVAPRSILRALTAAGVIGTVLTLAVLMAAPSLTDGQLASAGPTYVVAALFSGAGGKVLLTDVVIAICVATLAVQTAGSRMLFSMARDGVVPGARLLAKVPKSTGTPVWSAVVIGVLAILPLGLNLGSSSVFVNLETVCILLVYVAYLMVTVPMLYRRLRARRGGPAVYAGAAAQSVDGSGRSVFDLGRWGLPVNIAAVVYGLFMTVNLVWPRPEIYDPQGGHWYLQWFGVLFLLGSFAVGVGVYAWTGRTRVADAVALDAI